MPIWGGGSGAASGPWYSRLSLPIPDARAFGGLAMVNPAADGLNFGMLYEFESPAGALITENAQGAFTQAQAYYSLAAPLRPTGNPIWLVVNGAVGLSPGAVLGLGQLFSAQINSRKTDGDGSTLIGDGNVAVAEGSLILIGEIDTSSLVDTDAIDIRITMAIEETGGIAAAQGFVYSVYLTNVDPT